MPLPKPPDGYKWIPVEENQNQSSLPPAPKGFKWIPVDDEQPSRPGAPSAQPSVGYDRGFLGDVASRVARGGVQALKGVGGALRMSDLDPESDTGAIASFGKTITDFTDETTQKYDILKPDIGEVQRKEGFVKRGFLGGVESTPASLLPILGGAATGAATGAAVGSILGPGGAVAGGIIGAGVTLFGTFGLGEYQNTYDETKKTLLQKGYGFNEAKNLAHDHALTSAIAETGGEAVGDIAGAVVFKAILKQAVTNGVKQTIKQLIGAGGTKEFAKNLGKSMPFEVGSEMGTAYVQAKSAKKTGISDMSETEAMAEAVLPAAFMSLMFGASIRGLQEVQARGLYSDLNGDDPVTRAKAAIVVSKRMEDAESRRTWLNTANQYIKDGKPIPLNKPIIDFAIQKAEQDSAQDNTTQKPSEPPPGGQTFNGFEDFAGAYQGGATYDDLKGERDKYSKRPDADPNTLSDVDTFLGEIKPPVEDKIEELKSIHEANGITDNELIAQAGKLIAEYPNDKDKIKSAFPNVLVTLTDALRKSESVAPFTDESDALNKSIIENLPALKANGEIYNDIITPKESSFEAYINERGYQLNDLKNDKETLYRLRADYIKDSKNAEPGTTSQAAPVPEESALLGEAKKYKTAEEFEKAFLTEIKHGRYWHITDNPNFTIDPSLGPRDMSSLANGRMSKGKFMVTSDLEYWAEEYPERQYVAEIDMSNVNPKDYYQVKRGFGNEFFVDNPANARVIKVVPLKQALKDSVKYQKWLEKNVRGFSEIKDIWNKAHQKPETTPKAVEAKQPWQMTKDELETKYQKAGDIVDGRKVRSEIPNMDSIEASLEKPNILPGIYEIPLSEFGGLTGKHYSSSGTKRISELADEISINKEINPLIVVIDKEGPYILEGATRAEALYKLGAKSLPAKIVLDEDSLSEGKKLGTVNIPAKEPPKVVAAKEPWMMTREGTLLSDEFTRVAKEHIDARGKFSDIEREYYRSNKTAQKRMDKSFSDARKKASELENKWNRLRGAIQNLKEGKPVSPEILKEYPALVPKNEETGKTEESKVIPATKTAENNITTPKEQKAYVLDKLDGLIVKARQYWREINETQEKITDAEIDEMALNGRFSRESPEGEATVIIEVPNDGRYKVPNTLNNLLLFKKKFKSMSINTAPPDIKPPMPSKKPTGKPLSDIQKEMWEDYINLYRYYQQEGYSEEAAKMKLAMKEEYPELYEEVEKQEAAEKEALAEQYKFYSDTTEEEAEAAMWHKIVADVKNKEITLKSLSDKFNGKTPSFDDVSQKSFSVYNKLNPKIEHAESTKEEIKTKYPELYEKMFGAPKDVSFQRGKSAGLQQSQVQSVVDQALKLIPNPPKVNVIQSNQDCPEAVQRIMERDGIYDAMGFTHNGEVYLVSDNIRSEEETIRTLAHELTHSGLGKFFQRQRMPRTLLPVRAQYETLMDAIYQAHGEEVEQLVKTTHRHLKIRTVQGRRQACEEWLCNQSYDSQPEWYDKLVAIFNDLLRALGLNVKLSDAEVRVVLQDAFKEFGGEGVNFKIAHHGTPHVWMPEPGFPHGRPRLDKIGTGEGAAAFGWGIYFAEKVRVAKSYAKSVMGTWTPDVAIAHIISGFSSKKVAIDFYKNKLAKEKDKEERANIEAFIAKIEQSEIPGNSLYNLEIPDDVIPKLLDWDNGITDKQRTQMIHYVNFAYSNENPLRRQLIDVIESNPSLANNKYYLSGENLYHQLSSILGSDKAASNFLARADIPGNKYLDQMSREKGEGSYNYVIWDQKVLDRIALLERNGEKLDAIREEQEKEVPIEFQRSPVRRSQPMFSRSDNPDYKWWEGMDIRKQLESLPLKFWQKPRDFIAMGYVPITRAEADKLYYDGLDIFVAHVNIKGELDTTGNEGIFMRPLSFYGYKYWRYDGTRAQETEATYRYFKYRERYLQGRTGEIARQERRETVPVSEEAPERKVAESEVGYYRYSTKGEGNNLPIDDTIRNYWKKKVEEQYERNRTTRENGDVGFADDSRRERDNRIPYPSRLQLGRLFDENVRGLGEETERPQWESVVFAPELIDTPEFKVARDHFSSLGYTTVPISPVPWGMSVNHNLKAVFISPVSGDNFAYFMSHETSHILSKQGNMSIKAIRDGLDSKHPEFMDMAEQVGYNEDQMREEMSASIVGGWDRYKHLLTGKDSNKSIQDARKATIDSIPNKQETKFQRREKEATLALPPRKLTTNDAKKAWKIVEKADSYAPQEGETPIKHKIFFHSGTGNVDSVRKNGIEPTFGDWVREVLSGATGEEMDIENSFIPLSYYADLPDWLRMQTARKLKKNYYEVTRDDIKNHGYLAVIDNIDDQYGEANHTNIYQVVGENNGPQTVVENAYGEQKKLYETGLYEEGGFGNNREPFGIETGDFITDSGIMPDVVLTGDSLLDFMDAYKAKNPDIRFTRREKEAFDEASEPVPPEYDLGAFESKRKEIDDYVERLRRSLEFPETVMLARDLMGGKFPGIKAIVRSAFGNSAFGKFIPQGDGNILLKASIFNDIETASKTLAHEIGHLVDYIPNHLMTRGNILGRIASLNRYMKNYLEEFKGAPGLLTKEDKSRLQKEAREQIKAEEKPDEIIVEEIIKEIPQFEVSGISPEIILDLMKGRVEGTIAPELYEYLQRAETKEKKQIVMKAMKDMVDERVAQFGIKKQVGIETVKETVEKVIPGVKYDQQTIYKRFKELLQKEINKRVLYRKEVITDELKKLTKLWTPFDDSVDSSYRKYRWSGKELYADAFSVFINYPELMQGEAPTFYKAFLSWIESKPEVKKTYDAYQELATNREAVLERREKYIYEMQKKGDDKDSELIRQIEEENKISPKKVIRELYKGFIDRKVATVEAIKILRKAGKKDVADSLEYLKSEMNYLTAEQAAYADEASVRVIADMKKLGFTEADLGYLATLMRTATQRRDVANPGGMGGFFSDEQIEHLKNKLGVERFNALRGLLDKYTDLRQEFVIPKLEEAGMYSEALMETMKNERNYFTFDVIKFHNKMYGGAAEGSLGQVYHTIGTFQDIKNPFIATIMKDLALMRAAEITKYKKELYKIFSENDELREVYHVEKAKWDWNTKSFKQHEDPNIGLVVYLQNGKIEGFYVSKEIADDFKHKPIEAIHTLRVFNALMMAIKAMLVNRSPIWMIGNVFKDYMTTAQNINGATVTNLLPYYRKAFVDAWKEVRRGEKVDVVQAMKRGKMLVIDRQYSLSESTDDSEFDKLYARFGHHTDIERNVFTKPLIAAWDLLGDLGKVSERAGKIAGYRWLKENTNMSDRYIGHAVRNRIGTPDSYRQGSWQLLINNFFLYFNIGKEGFRSSWESFQENKGEYVWKLVKYNIIPKAVLALAALGAFGDDAEDIISRISNYDKANYLVIPFNKDEKGKVWYLRIPQGHMGQFWGAIMWDIFNLEFKKALQSFSAGQPFSVNPLIKETLNWGLYAMEVNPQDWYRGQSVINRVEWDAGEPYRAFEMSKHTWNSLGGSLLYKPQKGQDTKGVWERLSQFPGLNILGRLLKQSDQGINEAYYEAGEKAKRDAALKRMGKDEAVSKRKRIINILKDNDKRYHEGYIDAQLHSRMDKKYRDMLREN